MLINAPDSLTHGALMYWLHVLMHSMHVGIVLGSLL